MQTLIDPFEINPSYVVPPSRPPMATLSIDVDVDYDLVAALEERESARFDSAHDDDSARYPFAPRVPSQLDAAPDSWSRVRCWCSED